VSPTYTYRLNLQKESADILAGFDPKLRSDINKAIKDGVTVEKTNDMASVCSLVKKSLDNSLKTGDYIVDKILYDFSRTGKSFTIAAYLDEKMVSAVYCVFDSTTAYYILGGYDSDQKQRGAAGYALQAAILHAKELGLKVFDFEGSMIPSIESFFRSFGGELVPKFTVHRAKLPVEMLLKFFKRSVY
jgi:lipid II:glycine glycyltransferase (peptidoglycan interpeptide bridge formation enzyme)